MALKSALVFLVICLSIAGASDKILKIYINNDGTFALLPLGHRNGAFTAESLTELIPILTDTITEVLPQEVVLYAGEEINLNTILRVVNSVETASPKTKIRIVTPASYTGKPVLREFVVTPVY